MPEAVDKEESIPRIGFNKRFVTSYDSCYSKGDKYAVSSLTGLEI